MKIKILNSFKEVSETFYYKFKSLNLSKYESKSSDFVEFDMRSKDGFYTMWSVVYKPTNKKCLQLIYGFGCSDLINLVQILFPLNFYQIKIERIINLYLLKKKKN